MISLTIHGDMRSRASSFYKVFIYRFAMLILILKGHALKLQVGLLGEKLQIYKEEYLSTVEWRKIDLSSNQPLTWYKVCLVTFKLIYI